MEYQEIRVAGRWSSIFLMADLSESRFLRIAKRGSIYFISKVFLMVNDLRGWRSGLNKKVSIVKPILMSISGSFYLDEKQLWFANDSRTVWSQKAVRQHLDWVTCVIIGIQFCFGSVSPYTNQQRLILFRIRIKIVDSGVDNSFDLGQSWVPNMSGCEIKWFTKAFKIKVVNIWYVMKYQSESLGPVRFELIPFTLIIDGWTVYLNEIESMMTKWLLPDVFLPVRTNGLVWALIKGKELSALELTLLCGWVWWSGQGASCSAWSCQ